MSRRRAGLGPVVIDIPKDVQFAKLGTYVSAHRTSPTCYELSAHG